ncbi:MAG: SHOCT domain-containing protein [Spirochaetota bacterium]
MMAACCLFMRKMMKCCKPGNANSGSCCSPAMFSKMSKPGGMHTAESARDILDRRFAAGDITEEEYEKKKVLLSKNK